MCSVSLILKWGGRELLIPHSDKVLPPFVLAMIISLRCLQRTKTIYPALVVTSISEGKQETDCKFLNSVQFSSVAQSCLTLCDPMNHSTPGLSVYHQLLEFTQTHVHQVGDAI